MKKAVFLNDNFDTVRRVYGEYYIRYIDEKFGLAEKSAVKDLAACANKLQDCRYAFSTWGMPVYSEEEIRKYLPSLKAVFYAAGAIPLALDEMFARCDVISNHLADTPDTVKIMGKKQFGLMKPYSTFINTGRGAQVDECALREKLIADPTVTAVLDVTYPEPPDFSNGLFSLPNTVLTPHSAGSSGQEVHRMAEYMVRECENFASGGETKYEITKEMLSKMA